MSTKPTSIKRKLKKECLVRSVLDTRTYSEFEDMHSREGETQSSFIRRLILQALAKERRSQMRAA